MELGVAALFAPLVLLLLLLARPPSVPPLLLSLPSLGDMYLQLLRAAVRKGKAPKKLDGHPLVRLAVTRPSRFDPARYAGYLKLTGWPANADAGVPLTYPITEAFRLSMLAMAHPSFPFNVLGAVLARNRTVVRRPLARDEALLYSVRINPDYVKNDKGDIEIQIETTGATQDGDAAWRNVLTVIVINPNRARGGGGGKKAGEGGSGGAAPPPPEWKTIAEWSLPGDTGRRFGALTGDRNPIHLYPLTARLFGFKRPIAHALYLVARLEATLAAAGTAPSYPAAFATEFKRPTPLPAKLRAAVDAAGPRGGELRAAVLTADGTKEVLTGTLAVSAGK